MSSGSVIPIIDVAAISTTDDTSSLHWKHVAAQLGSSLATTGFVYLINHGIDPQIVDLAFEKSRSFFELSDEKKIKYLKGASVATGAGVKEYHGYAPPSKEILSPGVTDELRESFDMDRKIVADGKYPNVEVPGFQPALTNLEFQCRPLIKRILKLLAIALKLEDVNFFLRVSNCIEDPLVPSYTAFRSNYYPPIMDGVVPETVSGGCVVRCGEHTDYGIITLLFQDAIGGLEIKPGAVQQGTDNSWIQVPPILGTLLLNTGDMLEFWSGGRFPATWHRVRVPETTVQRRLHRQSIVYFVFPDDDAKISNLAHDHGADEYEGEGKEAMSSSSSEQHQELSAYEYATSRISKSYKY